MLQEEFDGLLRSLDPDREQAGIRYEDLRVKLARFFAWNDCFPEDDLVDMTFDRVAAKLKIEQVDNVIPFIWGVAKNIKREFYKRPRLLNIEELPFDKIPQSEHPEPKLIKEAEERRRQLCLKKCMHELSRSEREFFLEYEHYARKIANRPAMNFALSTSAVRTRAHRIRRRIEVCTQKCLQ